MSILTYFKCWKSLVLSDVSMWTIPFQSPRSALGWHSGWACTWVTARLPALGAPPALGSCHWLLLLPQWQSPGPVLRTAHAAAHLLRRWWRDRGLEHGRGAAGGRFTDGSSHPSMATGLGSAPPTLLRNASASPPAHLFSVGVLGLCCCVSFSVVVASWGYSLVACGLLVAVASRRGARL